MTNLMATASKFVQISSNLPWNNSENIDHLFMQKNIMFQQLSLIQTGTVTENNDKSTYQRIPVLEHWVELDTGERNVSDGSAKNVLKQVLNFAKKSP